MIQQTANFITVPEVGIMLGFEPENVANWTIGKKQQRRYTKATGALPVKDNRPKIRGGGENCKALYHEHWLEPISGDFRQWKMEAARQPDLFKAMEEGGGLYVPEYFQEEDSGLEEEVERLKERIKELEKERDEMRVALFGPGVIVPLRLPPEMLGDCNGNGEEP